MAVGGDSQIDQPDNLINVTIEQLYLNVSTKTAKFNEGIDPNKIPTSTPPQQLSAPIEKPNHRNSIDDNRSLSTRNSGDALTKVHQKPHADQSRPQQNKAHHPTRGPKNNRQLNTQSNPNRKQQIRQKILSNTLAISASIKSRSTTTKRRQAH